MSEYKQNKFKKNSEVPMSFGKLPPCAPELEQVILGAIMLEPNSMSRISDIIHSKAFYKHEHQIIFEAMNQIFKEGKTIDMLIVTQQVRKMGELERVGGPLYISQLTDRVVSTGNLEEHCRIVVQTHILREMIRLSSEIMNQCYDDTIDLFDIMDNFNTTMGNILSENVKQDAVTSKTLAQQMVKEIELRQQQVDNYVSGIPSGMNTVNKMLGGYKKSASYILAARPAMGKSAFLLSEALEMAKQGTKVAIFSLEMSKTELMWRITSQETGIDSRRVSENKLTQDELAIFNSHLGIIESLPIWIDDTAALSVFDLRAKATRLKARHGIEIVFVDYLQLMTVGNSGKSNSNREQDIGTISRTLKQIAKELEIPVVSLGQLSRAVEARNPKIPMLSDLRESGSIEQDADVVMFLYRAEYYGETEFADGSSTAGIGELIVAKQRGGITGQEKLAWTAHLTRYSDLGNRGQSGAIQSKPSPLPQNTNFLNTNEEAPF